MKTPIESAIAQFDMGYNCSQAVFSAFAEQLGLTEEDALKIASTFGGGISHLDEVCGAVSGALMALGLACGNTDAADRSAKDRNYALAQAFAAQFKKRNGTIRCSDLLGCDLSNPEDLQHAREQGIFKSRCPGYVRDAAELVEALIKTANS